MVKLPLEVRKRLCDYVLGKPLVAFNVYSNLEEVEHSDVGSGWGGRLSPISGFPLHNLMSAQWCKKNLEWVKNLPCVLRLQILYRHVSDILALDFAISAGILHPSLVFHPVLWVSQCSYPCISVHISSPRFQVSYLLGSRKLCCFFFVCVCVFVSFLYFI